MEVADVGGDFKITIIYDNTAFDERLKPEWGFAALVQYDGHTILFDTGGTAPTFLENLHLLEIDPLEIEAVVISHEHGDHTAGLLPFLEIADRPTVYLLSTFSSAFINSVSAQTEVIRVVQPVEIFPGMFSTGTLSGDGISEQALVVDRGGDIVVITGCSHPGIINMVRRARTVAQPEGEVEYKPIALVIGGFHLLRASREDVEDISAELRSLGVQHLSPTHCTGEPAIDAFADIFGEDYIPGGAGQIIALP
jgi:7,8-dihydropterin-6-yl-methyl-4-(beta-D-ribofuranosyl)aminobenzene 5'-phosphate synthase